MRPKHIFPYIVVGIASVISILFGIASILAFLKWVSLGLFEAPLLILVGLTGTLIAIRFNTVLKKEKKYLIDNQSHAMLFCISFLVGIGTTWAIVGSSGIVSLFFILIGSTQ